MGFEFKMNFAEIYFATMQIVLSVPLADSMTCTPLVSCLAITS